MDKKVETPSRQDSANHSSTSNKILYRATVKKINIQCKPILFQSKQNSHARKLAMALTEVHDGPWSKKTNKVNGSIKTDWTNAISNGCFKQYIW